MITKDVFYPLSHWFQRKPLPQKIWTYNRYIQNGDYLENCYKHMVHLYVNWNGQRWTKEKFIEESDNNMCSAWNKDYENEFDTYNEYENACQLAGEKNRNDLYALPFSDEMIIFAVRAMCNLEYYHDVASITKVCEEVKNRAELHLRDIELNDTKI